MTARRRLAVPLLAVAICAPGALVLDAPASGAPAIASRPAARTPAATPGTALQTPAAILKASAKRGSHWKPGPAEYGVGSHLNRPIKGAGGVTLRADVYYPTDPKSGKAAKGPFPVLLIQSPYGKSTAGASGFAASTGEDAYLIKHGYIDVVSDVRGTGDSEGKFGFFDPIQTRDSKRVLRWAARLPHSTHQVGLYGASYLGIDQIQLAGAVGRHSPLKAIFPVVSANDIYRDTAFMGGILDSEFGAVYIALTSGLNIINPLASPQNLKGLTKIEIKHLEDLYSFDSTFTAKTLANGPTAFDGSYWRARQPNKALRNIVKRRIPAYLIGGEYDLFQRGEPLNYAALQNLADGRRANAPMRPGQKVTGRYQLWDGPFTHLTGSAVNTDELELRWFDTWLKHEHTGMAKTKTPLHYYDLGTSTYRETTTYPFTGLHAKQYYFGAHNRLTRKPTGGGKDTLLYTAEGNPCGAAVDQWAIGPIESAEQIGGFNHVDCVQDNSASQVSPTILNYTSRPFKKTKTIGGPISARIYASATTKDTQWVAEIEDVNPHGKSRPLTEGALLGSLRARNAHRTWRSPHTHLPLLPFHRYTRSSRRPVTPGKTVRYDIEIFPTLDTILAGHRLRITLTTADAPHLQPAAPVATKLIGGVYTIMRTKARPSSLYVPVGRVKR